MNWIYLETIDAEVGPEQIWFDKMNKIILDIDFVNIYYTIVKSLGVRISESYCPSSLFLGDES